MKRFLLAFALLVLPMARAEWIPTSGVAYNVSEVQRKIYTLQHGELYCTFTTVYQIQGRPVGRAVFWAELRPGLKLQMKLERVAGVLAVRRINLVKP